MSYPVSILYKSIAGRYRPVRVADGPITARHRFIKNAGWVCAFYATVTRYLIKAKFLIGCSVLRQFMTAKLVLYHNKKVA